jgi:hypothetical protein
MRNRAALRKREKLFRQFFGGEACSLAFFEHGGGILLFGKGDSPENGR